MINFKIRRIFGVLLRQTKAILNFFELFNHIYWVFFSVITYGFLAKSAVGTRGDINAKMVLTNLAIWYIVPRGATFVALPLLKDLSDMSLVGLMSTPITIIEWIIAQLIIGTIGAVFSFFSAVIGIKLIFGFNILPPLGWTIIPSIISMLISGWVLGILTLIILLIYGKKTAPNIYALGWLFAPISNVFYPIEIMPLCLQKVTNFIPMFHIFDAIKKINQPDFSIFSPFIKSMGLNIVYFVLSIIIFFLLIKRRKTTGLTNLETEA